MYSKINHILCGLKNNGEKAHSILLKKWGSPVHVGPACTRSGKGSDHFGFYVQHFLAFLQEVVSRT
jgi:hypothetical protein